MLQKTLDLLGQLRGAVVQAPPTTIPGATGLLSRFDQADELLRRGVVEASYRWAVAGPPSAENAAVESEPWPSESPLASAVATGADRRRRVDRVRAGVDRATKSAERWRTAAARTTGSA